MKTENNPKGAGRKPLPEGMKPYTIKLSDQHVEVLKVLGNGQLARGIRKAAELAILGK